MLGYVRSMLIFDSETMLAAVIYPSLKLLKDNMIELAEDSNKRTQCSDSLGKKLVEEKRKIYDSDVEREDECGICMETCTRMVLPNCGHSMCACCFHDWYMQLPSKSAHTLFIAMLLLTVSDIAKVKMASA